jgi:hypothetical protein
MRAGEGNNSDAGDTERSISPGRFGHRINRTSFLSGIVVEFWNYIALRDCRKRFGSSSVRHNDRDRFYRELFDYARAKPSEALLIQGIVEENWERARRPYYNLWPSIVPMLIRLDLSLDSAMIQVPRSALAIRFPKSRDEEFLKFSWRGKQISLRSMLLGDIGGGETISILMDTGEVMEGTDMPLCTFQNFPRREGLSVEQALSALRREPSADVGVQVPDSFIKQCVRLCCTLCLLENDPEVISPDVLADDRRKYEETGDPKYVDKAHRRGKVGWDVGKHIEIAPHYRRSHPMLVWTGPGRAAAKIVLRRGSIVHRSIVEKVPTGFDSGPRDE